MLRYAVHVGCILQLEERFSLVDFDTACGKELGVLVNTLGGRTPLKEGIFWAPSAADILASTPDSNTIITDLQTNRRLPNSKS